jgi:hypothetical protein
LPAVAWDLAVTAVWTGVTTPVVDLVTAKELKVYPIPVEQGRFYISYDLATRSVVHIDLFDIQGNLVAGIFNGMQPAGAKLIEWKRISGKIAPGIYLLTFRIGHEMATRQITIYK